MLRDVLERYEETQGDEMAASTVNRKSELISLDQLQACRQSLDKIHTKLQALFHKDGKVKRRKALTWPFQSAESAALMRQLRGLRDNLAATLTADSLEVSVKIHDIVANTHGDVKAIKANTKSGMKDW